MKKTLIIGLVIAILISGCVTTKPTATPTATITETATAPLPTQIQPSQTTTTTIQPTEMQPAPNKVVTLSTAAKNWLAINAGAFDCFSPSGVSYTDANGASHTGSTGDVLNALYAAHLAGRDTIIIIAGRDYTMFKAINSEVDINLDDVGFVNNNDGSPASESKYCATVP